MADDGSNKVIGGFRVLKDLKAGAGSQGTVYKAVCEVARFPTVAIGDVVALKVMAVQDDDGSEFARLESRTAELVALDHPNIVKYHGCFREKGPFNDVHVIVLEYVEGNSLKDMLSASPCGLGVDEAMRIALGLVDGLVYTSAHGIVHRDIKPANVIVRPDGTPKLIDFEVAHRVEGAATVGGSNMIGTFDYMAPDFTDSEFRGDVKSDVFSLGVCLHEMLTGRTPYRRQSGTSTQANVAFLQRWLKAGTSANPLRVSSRVGKLLSGARDLMERALQPDRSKRIPDFVTFKSEMRRVRYRELAHAGRKWRLLSYIGRGGFGEVFGAVDCATGERVAIKHLLNESGLDRFRREADTLRRVSNAGFPRYIDYFQSDDGGAFLVMDYLEGMPGRSLKHVLRSCRDGGIDSKTALTAFARYAHALAGLHAAGIVHRDIKPANLYFPVSDPGKAVIMDLGIARDISGTATVGHVPGTIDYMPPECVTGKTRGGPEADIWALGLCLYETLAGKPAYPRLPEGSAAFQEYFARVNKGVRPDFTSVDNNEIRELLDQMCELDSSRRLRDARLVERRLRIANGENPVELPMPNTEFVWDENREGAGVVEDAESDSISAATRPTVWGDGDVLEAARTEFERRRHDRKKRFVGFVVLTFSALLLAAGAFGVWKYAEYTKAVALEEAEKRAREAEERERIRLEELRKAEEEAEAQRQIEEAKRKAEEEAKRKADEEARRKLEEARRREEEAKRKAEEARRRAEEAKRKAEEVKRRAEEEAKRKADEEARRKAEEEVVRRLEEARRQAEEARRRADEEERRQLAAAAEAKRIADEIKRKVEEANKRKAEEEKAKRKAEEAKRRAEEAKRKADEDERIKAEAERNRKEKEKLALEIDKEAEDRRLAEIKRLDSEFAAYTLEYNKRLDEALKPGSRTDPVSLQREFLIKRNAYREARKKLEKTK